MKLSNSNGIQLAFRNPWTQKSLLVVFIVAIFWHGLWGGVPRSDQLPYLYQVSQFHDLGSIILNSASWNRTQGDPGDSILFRPLLYLQLGIFYFLFAYNFFLWQLASLVLHILVVLILYSLLIQGRLNKTVYPFLFSMLFGSSLLGSELVFWHHISGYLTFSVLFVGSVFCLVKYFSTKKEGYAWIILWSGVISEFMYEFGIVLNLLMATSLLYNWILIKNRRDLKWALIFFAVPILYPILSMLDLWSLGIFSQTNLPQNIHTQWVIQSIDIHKINFFQKLSLAIWYAAKQIGFWFVGWILPTVYDVKAVVRLFFRGFKYSDLIMYLNCSAVLAIIYVICRLIKEKTVHFFKINRTAWLTALCSFIFIFAFSFVIAYGRAVPKGLEYVLNLNIHYSYIFYLAFMIGVALFTLDYDNTAKASDRAQPDSGLPQNRQLYLKKSIPFLFLIIIILNAHCTYQVAKSYRYQYSPPRQRVIDAVEEWLSGDGKDKNAYFRMRNGCEGNQRMGWFNTESYRNNPGWPADVNMADVLFSEKSFRFHERDSRADQYHVFDIGCPNF